MSLFAREKQDANHPFASARITPSELRFRLPPGPEGRWKLAGGRAKRTPPDQRPQNGIRPGWGGGNFARAFSRAPAGAHDFLDGTIRWCSLAALARPPANFLTPSGRKKIGSLREIRRNCAIICPLFLLELISGKKVLHFSLNDEANSFCIFAFNHFTSPGR